VLRGFDLLRSLVRSRSNIQRQFFWGAALALCKLQKWIKFSSFIFAVFFAGTRFLGEKGSSKENGENIGEKVKILSSFKSRKKLKLLRTNLILNIAAARAQTPDSRAEKLLCN